MSFCRVRFQAFAAMSHRAAWRPNSQRRIKTNRRSAAIVWERRGAVSGGGIAGAAIETCMLLGWEALTPKLCHPRARIVASRRCCLFSSLLMLMEKR